MKWSSGCVVFFILCTFTLVSCKGENSSDQTRPTVVSVTPANANTDTAINPTVSVHFSEEMDPESITSSTIIVKDASNNTFPGTILYDVAAMKATLTLSTNLQSNTTYTATITTGVKGISGNSLEVAYSWSFTTAAFTCPFFSPPSPDWCSDGTILPPSIDENGCYGPPTCQ